MTALSRTPRPARRMLALALVLGLGAAALVAAAWLQARRWLARSRGSRDLPSRSTDPQEGTAEGLLTVDREGHLTSADPMAGHLLRRAGEALVGQSVSEVFPGGPDGVFERKLRQAREQRTAVAFEAWAAPLERWLAVTASPTREGLAVRLRSRTEPPRPDVDDLRRANEALRTSEERFRLLARAANDALFDWDLRSRTTWWSESFEALTGSPPQAVRTVADWRQRVHPDDMPGLEARVREALVRGPDHWTRDFRLQRGDGTWARVHARGDVIRDEAGRAVRMVGALSDETERMQLEEQLQQSQRLDALGQLTGGVAHDFNNLLTVILGNAETLEDELAGQPGLHSLAAMVRTAAERGAGLTQRLLAFARKQALAPVTLDVGRQLAELEPLLQRSLGEHVALTVRTAPDLWPALVDPTQLDNALLNLCLNARDAMPGGGELTVRASNAVLDRAVLDKHPDVSPGEYVKITVTDTGRGIAAEHAARLFEPFFTTKEVGKGTGLGLAMVYGFVKQSGGQVSIASQPGRGTSVTLYLPRAHGAAVPRRRPPRAGSGRGEGTVLLVEDDLLVRGYARRQLEDLGYRVLEAAGAGEAIAILRGPETVDLLFTDVVMPGMAGPQLVEAARRERPGLKVLYTSGHAEDVVVHHGPVGAGGDLLAKPYSREELARRVRAVIAGTLS